jgi:serine/threonine-protein kinase
VKGKILGSRYKVLSYIAEGGFGKTFLAEDILLPQKDRCVVKQLLVSVETSQLMAVARRLFKTEAATLHSLGHHQQIPKLLAYFEEDGKFYLVQQYIEGQTLEAELATGEVWSEDRVIELLKDGLSILEFIHSKGIIHRDLKPNNLIRRPGDRKLVLVDFGTVKKVLQEQTSSESLTVVVGTKGYMPAEQAMGKPLPSSDLYALGTIAIQALTQVQPLELEEENGELVWQHLAKVDPRLAKIITQMTRYHFKDRYQSARLALQDLKSLCDARVRPQAIATVTTSAPGEPELAVTSVSNYNLANTIQPNLNSDRDLSLATEISPDSVTVPQFEKKTSLRGMAIALILIIIGGVYLLMQQSQSNIPTSKPSSTPRTNQGEGFRRDL